MKNFLRIFLAFLIAVSGLHSSGTTLTIGSEIYDDTEFGLWVPNESLGGIIEFIVHHPNESIEYEFGPYRYSGIPQEDMGINGETLIILKDQKIIGPSSGKDNIKSYNFRIQLGQGGSQSGGTGAGSPVGGVGNGSNAGGGTQVGGNGVSKGSGSAAGGGSGGTDWNAAHYLGLQAGLKAGIYKAFQDYIMLRPGTIEQIEKQNRHYQKTAEEAAKAYSEQQKSLNSLSTVAIQTGEALSQALNSSEITNKNLAGIIDAIRRNNQVEVKSPREIILQQLNPQIARPAYRADLEKTILRYESSPRPISETQVRFKEIAVDALNASVMSENLTDYELADATLEIAKKATDVLFGIDPFTGVFRSTYEVLVGKNIVTGDKLTDFERALSGVSLAGDLVTLGATSSMMNGIKAVTRIVRAKGGIKALTPFVKIAEASKKIISTLEKLKAPLKTQASKIARWLGKEAKTIDDIPAAFSKGIANGEFKSLERLSDEILKNPKHPQLIKRFRDVAVDGIKLGKNDIKVGTNGKVALIGRDMERIEKYARKLEAEGLVVELFDADWMASRGGSSISKDAMDQFNRLKIEFNGNIPAGEITKSIMFNENIKWANKLKDEGYTLINTGVPGYVKDLSPFYEEELKILEFIGGHL